MPIVFAQSVTTPTVAPSFLPTDVSGLFQWLIAGDGTYQDTGTSTPAIADNDRVGGWVPKTGSSNTEEWTQTTAGQRPTLKTNIFNGLPAVLTAGPAFEGYLKSGVSPGFSALTAAEIFIVLKVATEASNQGIYDFSPTDGTLHPYSGDGLIYDSFGTSARKNSIAFTPGTLSAPHLYNAITTSSEYTMSINGTQLFTTGTNTVSFNTLGVEAWIGVNSEGAGSDAYFAEICVYNAKISAGNRTSLKAYFASKYSITIA